MHTHYDNLKVTRGAPPEVIRAAYKALSQHYHPDKNNSPDAERIMRIINEAYNVLGDPDRRSAYDRELAAREQQASKMQGPSQGGGASGGSKPGTPAGSSSTGPKPAAPKPAAPKPAAPKSTGPRTGDTSASASKSSGPKPAAHKSAEPQPASSNSNGSREVHARSWPWPWSFAARHKQPEFEFKPGAHPVHQTAGVFRARTKQAVRSRTVRLAAGLAIVLGAAWMGWQANQTHRPPGTLIAANAAQHADAAGTWTNPVTSASIRLDGVWVLSVSKADKGEPVYTFTDEAGRAAVVFAREDMPEVGIDSYVPAYLRTHAASMPLGAPGTRDTIDGHESWSADGHLTADPAMRAHVELRHIGSSFWRVVTMQAQPYDDTDEATSQLTAQ
jgi:curved DNA-binding protein CbpA